MKMVAPFHILLFFTAILSVFGAPSPKPYAKAAAKPDAKPEAKPDAKADPRIRRRRRRWPSYGGYNSGRNYIYGGPPCCDYYAYQGRRQPMYYG